MQWRLVQVRREALREEQIAQGRVWTRAATLGHNYGAAIVQEAVDEMTDEELAAKVCPPAPPRYYTWLTTLACPVNLGLVDVRASC